MRRAGSGSSTSTRSARSTDSVSYPGGGPRDTEDLALSPDGKTLWIADTGNNITSDDQRESIVLWSMPVDGGKQPTLHRFVYPDDKPRDAEALVLTGTGDGTPLVDHQVDRPGRALRPGLGDQEQQPTGVPLKKVGDLTLPKTETPNCSRGRAARRSRGAARADGTKVVLRTYADAFEWDVAEGGDVVAALTATPSRGSPA